MSDTTTIEIRDDQLEQLKAMKRVDRESYKSVVDRLLDGDTDVPSAASQSIPSSVENDTSDIQEQLDRIESALGDTVAKSLEIGDSRNPVQLEATEYGKIADEVEARLR